jgi:hypothetical protein
MLYYFPTLFEHHYQIEFGNTKDVERVFALKSSN